MTPRSWIDDEVLLRAAARQAAQLCLAGLKVRSHYAVRSHCSGRS